jgi:hypothetical protein
MAGNLRGPSYIQYDEVLALLSPMRPTVVFETYWRFAAERQEVFFRRMAGASPPWTADPILQEFRFTNAYRASDRVSQFLIRHVIYGGQYTADDLLFRILLFKLFNKIETWFLLEETVGPIAWKSYDFARYDSVLTGAMEQGTSIFSAAYIMPTGTQDLRDPVKHRVYLRLLERMMGSGLSRRVAQCRSMRDLFELLRGFPLMGDFLAYQFATDINYSELTAFSENEFVVPGPGARSGLSKCFTHLGGLAEGDAIRFIAGRQEPLWRAYGISFKTLWGRQLQLIDCQNLFCEVDKYARVAHPDVSGRSDRKRIKQKLRPVSGPLTYWFPPKWGINEAVAAGPRMMEPNHE